MSQAFETNASVDASFTDAVAGTKQIGMLGLDGTLKFSGQPSASRSNVVQGLISFQDLGLMLLHLKERGL